MAEKSKQQSIIGGGNGVLLTQEKEEKFRLPAMFGQEKVEKTAKVNIETQASSKVPQDWEEAQEMSQHQTRQ